MKVTVGFFLAFSVVTSVAGVAGCNTQSDAQVEEDGGGVGGGGSEPDLGPDPNASVCTSGVMWTRGDRGSTFMHPGVACINCHLDNGASSATSQPPLFGFAGTLYPTTHEPDDCNGVAGAKVTVTDANGKVTTVTVNSSGNFFSTVKLAFPFTAKVVTTAGKERAMMASQMSGDCNSCHTETGTMTAPGRIQLPN